MKRKESFKSNPKSKSETVSKSASEAASPDKPDAQKEFIVVGLGASAGGIKPLKKFFALMPPSSGMAFVVVLHLSPQHESNLAEVLQTQTTMPVMQVNETLKVEPNHVYVIPPTQNLEMTDGVIRLTKQDGKRGPRAAIDIFFRSLADAYDSNAVCVVLSGTGADGTIGLKRVKEANGFAIVQEPRDAEYEEMPRSAIGTRLADWVLPVEKMPQKLLDFRDSSERLHLTTGDAEKVAREIKGDESLRDILTLLRVRTGHDFSNYKTPTLVRRIARHLQIHELENIPAYLDFLRQNPEEINSLLRNLLINVTNFFRDRKAFEALENEVVPHLFEEKTARDMVRVWTAACASGEEAFSIAMLLAEYAEKMHDPPRIQIFASDVDDQAINEAREHLYPETIEADVSPERLRRFFIKEDKFYRVRKELREMILFAPHNVLRDPPFSRLDLITCRNLLIYLTRETQEKLMEIFHFALRQNGFLFLGSSESAENTPQLFAPVNKKQRIYRRRSLPGHPGLTLPQMPLAGRWQMPIDETRHGATGETKFSYADVHRQVVEEFAPPSVLVNENLDIIYMSRTAGKYLRFSGGEPTANLLKLVHPDLVADTRAGLFVALRDKKPSEFKRVRALIDDKEVMLNITARPVAVGEIERDLLLVLFEETGEKIDGEQFEKTLEQARQDDAMEAVVRRLEDDLQRAKASLRSTVEQYETTVEELKASNEELQAINEELRSASEELETSKEELQSVNEELVTVNHEFKEKIDEANSVNADLRNLIASTDIATIFLDRSLQIKRYTPQAQRLFNIQPGDIGRPLSHFTHFLDYPDLVKDADETLQKLTPLEREIADAEDRRYLARFHPYLTVENKVEGVVLNFIDITERKNAEIALAEDLRNTEILHDLSQQIVTEENIQKLYDDILKAAILLTRADAGTVQLYDEKTKELALLAAEGFSRKMTGHFRRVDASSKTPCGVVLAKGRRVILDFDEPDEGDSESSNRMHTEAGYRSAQSTPLIARSGKPIGMFTTHWRERRRPTERELRFLDILARQAADLIEYWQTEKALRASEEKYRRLFDSIDEGFCIFELQFDDKGKAIDWIYLEANPAFERQTGFLDPVGKRISDFQPGLERSWFDRFTEVARTGEPVRFEQYTEVMGVWYDVYAVNVGAPGDNRISLLFNDITERKYAEEALRESEERFRAFVTASSDVVYSMSADWSEMRFLEGKEFLPDPSDPSKTWIEKYIHPDDQPQVLKVIKQAIETKSVFELEHRVIRADGSLGWTHSRAIPLLNEAGEISGWFGTARDITERKQTEEVVRHSEEQLKLVMESVKDYAIIIFDLDGRITRWNEGAERIFGFTPEEAVGRMTHLIFTAEDRAAGVPEKELVKALKKGRAEDERWHIRKDGSRFFASGVMQILQDGGKPQGFVKIARDQTEKLKAEKALSDKTMLAQLVSTQEDERRRIARDLHDHLGQQLTSLRLKLQTTQKMCGDETVCDEIETAQKIAEQIDRDVDFLAWELRPAALDDLGLRSTLGNFVNEWARYTQIKTDFHAAGLTRTRLAFEIETNLYRITQEALNNVHKHAKAKQVSVLLEKRGKMISLIIEDDGVGFNIEKNKKRTGGLGLPGMSERAKLCGGTLEIETEKNKGTTIFVRIPLEK